MAVDLQWQKACSASRAFTEQERAAGWPESMTLAQLAAVQHPPESGSTQATRARQVLQAAMAAACGDGSLPHDTVQEVSRTPVVTRVPSDFGGGVWPDAYIRDGERLAYTTGGKERVVTHQRVRPRHFAAWLHAQRETPGAHMLAWFEARGVAWPPVAVAEVPTDWAGLVDAVKSRRKGTPWSDAERVILRAEFARRSGWTQQSDGAAWGKDAAVQAAVAAELGVARQALDRHLGAGPDAGASAFSGMANVFIRAR